MVKVRLQGLPDEVQSLVKSLKQHYTVLQESAPYPNRNSEYVRVYIDLTESQHKTN